MTNTPRRHPQGHSGQDCSCSGIMLTLTNRTSNNSKSSCIASMRRQPREGWDVLTSSTSNRGVIARIYKELKTQRENQTTKQITNGCDMSSTLKWLVLGRPMSMWKRSRSLTIREMHIQSTLKLHLTPVSMAIINQKNWWGCRQNGALTQCWGELRLMQLQWKLA